MTKITFPSHISPEECLAALWSKSLVAGFFSVNGLPNPPIKRSAIRGALKHNYADYVCGRVIKTSFDDYPHLNSLGYDRDNGNGAMEDIRDNIDQILKEVNVIEDVQQ